jgi:hypothetical protein
MRFIRLFVVSLLAFSGMSMSQEIRVGRGGNLSHFYPGSYRQTCVNIYATRRLLEAECKDKRGNYRSTYLEDPRLCIGDISNNDGRLECNKPHDTVPQGSFRATCRNETVYRDTLSADCKNRRGDYVHSTLQYFWECRGDIANDDGYLVCE